MSNRSYLQFINIKILQNFDVRKSIQLYFPQKLEISLVFFKVSLWTERENKYSCIPTVIGEETQSTSDVFKAHLTSSEDTVTAILKQKCCTRVFLPKEEPAVSYWFYFIIIAVFRF